MDTLSTSTATLADTTYPAQGRIKKGAEENLIIVERIATRDPAGAEEAARVHMYNASTVILLRLADQD